MVYLMRKLCERRVGEPFEGPIDDSILVQWLNLIRFLQETRVIHLGRKFCQEHSSDMYCSRGGNLDKSHFGRKH